jgi:hypothetical protein
MIFNRSISFKVILVLLAMMIPTPGFSVSGGALTIVTAPSKNGRISQPLNFSQIWFYDRHMNLVVPEIDPQWIAVVFDPAASSVPEGGNPEGFFARRLMDEFHELQDFLCDRNLAEGACFFTLGDTADNATLESMLSRINRSEIVAYAHPTIRIGSKRYAFFNLFELSWKAGVSDLDKKRILDQVNAHEDIPGEIYRIDVYNASLFPAVHLIAQDLSTRYALPVLVEIVPSIESKLLVNLPGGNIGDPIPFSLYVSFSSRVRIEESSFSIVDLRPRNVHQDLCEVTFDPFDHVAIAQKSPILITGAIKLFTPGEFVIPSVPVRYTCPSCSGEVVKTIETSPVTVKIASIIPSGSPAILIGPGKKPATLETLNRQLKNHRIEAHDHLIKSIFFFFLSLLSLLCFLFHRSKIRERVSVVDTLDTGPEIIRKALIDQLDGIRPSPSCNDFPAIFDLLKDYVVQRYRIDKVYAKASADIFLEQIQGSLPPLKIKELSDIMSEVDDIIAREISGYGHWDSLKKRVTDFLRDESADDGYCH